MNKQILEELVQKVMHPNRLQYLSHKYNIDFEDLLDMYSLDM